MTDIPIPSEDDFKKLEISSPRDFIDEALADGLIKDGDTRSMHERTYVPVSQRGAPALGQSPKTPTKNTSWASDRAWIDLQKIVLSLTMFEYEVDNWERDNENALTALHQKGSDLYNEIACDAVGDARDNARSLRFL